jgi:hypothetical protein
VEVLQAKKRKHPAVIFDVPKKLYVSQKRKRRWGTRRPKQAGLSKMLINNELLVEKKIYPIQ